MQVFEPKPEVNWKGMGNIKRKEGTSYFSFQMDPLGFGVKYYKKNCIRNYMCISSLKLFLPGYTNIAKKAIKIKYTYRDQYLPYFTPFAPIFCNKNKNTSSRNLQNNNNNKKCFGFMTEM